MKNTIVTNSHASNIKQKNSNKTLFPNIITVIIINFVVFGCSFLGSKSDDLGSFNYTKKRNWINMKAPMGMVRIPSGSFMSGVVDQDIMNKDQNNRRVTISEFFMHETEVTNSQYRKFLEVLSDRFQNLSTQSASQNLTPASNATPAPNANNPTTSLDRLEAMLSVDFIDTLYPDPDVWRNDFSNSMADTYLEDYFNHAAFDDYPVVGITWDNATLYAEWQTQYLNENRAEKGEFPYPSFVLPSAAQWEYAARGGQELAKYPWGGPYIRDAKGQLRANFKSASGNYSECGYSYTSPVTAFLPNDFGLYDMAGNVAEWTRDAYNPVAIRETWDLDPLYVNDDEPIKIIKGGSWKDISRFLQTGEEDYEHKDKARSFIGFRCVMPSIGQK